jgi:probable F420-dependent oxidoreductase
MRVGVAVPTWGPFSDLGVLSDYLSVIEELGFDSAWFADHVAIPTYATDRFSPPMLEPLAVAAWALAKHDRLDVGTDVLVAPYRHPVLVAATAGSIQALSGGRLILGVGIGYLRGEMSALGIEPDRRGPVTDESLEALRTLWSGRGPHRFGGATFEFEDVLPVAVPATPVPLLVGGNNARARLRAARLGDGWHPLYPTPDRYAQSREEIQRLRSEHGVTRPFVFSLSTPNCQILDGPARRSRRRQPAASSSSVRASEVRPEYRYAPELPRDGDGRPLLCGTREQVSHDLLRYERAGVEQIVLRVWTYVSQFGPDGAMEQLRKWADLLAEMPVGGG